MPTATLTRRRTQLALLERACHDGAQADVRLRDGAAGERTWPARFEQLRRDVVLMHAGGDGAAALPERGVDLAVEFDLDGVRYSFVSESIGRCGAEATVDCATTWTWALRLPLCVERRERRSGPRLALRPEEGVVVRLRGVDVPERALVMQVTDVSDGGLSSIGAVAADLRPSTGEVFWAALNLPGAPSAAEFVLRLVRASSTDNGRMLRLGWAFCASDDAGAHGAGLKRIEEFVQGARRRAAPRATSG